jgi:DNA glycosylase AlkZ-like
LDSHSGETSRRCGSILDTMHKQARALNELTPAKAVLERTARQSLLESAEVKDLAGVVRALCGVNAQQGNAMMLSLRARIKGLERTHVLSALEGGGLVRAWVFRGTMHLVDPDDLRSFLPGLGRALIAGSARRYRELGLTGEVLELAASVVPAALSASAPAGLTRHELAEAMSERGLSIDGKGQALIHLIRFVALSGLIYIGPDNQKGEPTYMLLDPPAPQWAVGDGSELAGLALRYLEGYGPADSRDFAAWSGVGQARAGKAWEVLGGECATREVAVLGRELSLPDARKPGVPDRRRGTKVVRLLPAFDSYTLGYADRELVVPGERRADVYHGGQTAPVVLVDGRAAGTWRYEKRGRRLRITARAFDSFRPAVRREISAEAEDIGRFFDAAMTLDVE